MSDATIIADTHDIVVDEVFPHAPQLVWKTLTTPELMSRWLKMPPVGFAPVVGNRFTYQTTAAGAWDGLIRCLVLEVIPDERLAYEWRGGDEGNVGYGSRLETIVTWTLTPVQGGVRVRMVHSGFRLPRNETAYRGMSHGWPEVLQRLQSLSADA